MKKIALTTLFLDMAISLLAGPAMRGVWKTIQLTDGSVVRVELRGDEYAHFWVSEEGKCYVKAEGNSQSYHEVNLKNITDQALEKRQAMAESTGGRRLAQKRVIVGGTHEPYVGNKRCLVVLVNFANSKFGAARDIDYYKRMTNEEGFTDSYGNTHSVRDFFLAQSYGQLSIDFDVAGPIQLEHDYAYYGGNMQNVYEMIIEACNGAHDEGIDFSQYDWDDDGTVDQVFVLYAGHDAASYDDPDLVWAHMSYLSGWGKTVTFDGVKVDTYACSAELTRNGDGGGIGSMCHEFSHCMGLPDVYDTGYGGNYGMDSWSIMGYGSYNGDNCGYLPAGYTSYERMYCGWLTPIELTEETEVTGMKGLTEGGEAYIIYNEGNRNEYYLLENRTPYDFDAGLYGSGMLVVHIDYHATCWRNNIVNATNNSLNDHQRYTVIAADDSYATLVSNIAADAYPTASNNRLNNNSTPADVVYNVNTDGSYYMGISISNITKASDGTISFKFYPEGTDPNHGNPPEGAIFYESFDYCTGLGGNDGTFGGDGVGAGTFVPDNSGWVSSTSHGGASCAMFGSNTQVGNVVTPTFTINEETILTFRAAPYTALIPATLALSCETSGITLSETELTLMQGQWTNCAITLSGAGEVSIRIKETSGVQRFFLDEVAAVPARLSGVEVLENSTVNVKRKGIYSLNGVYLGTNVVNLRKGVYIVNGKKYVAK